MAEYCKQCAEDLYESVDHGDDLAGLVTRAQSEVDLFAGANCEGCGQECKVDYAGYCQSNSCACYHGDY